jgi:MoaA/NifB/PqqE/SkfB family radical SAM enzyme
MLKGIHDLFREKFCVIIPTLLCNSKCAHCILSCSPMSNETMNLRMFQDCILQFLELNFNPICLTGGEPFLFPDIVKEASRQCVIYSKALVIQTNGFWAASPLAATQMLELIPYISQLGFSHDYAHMPFVSRQTIVNGIEAAYKCGITNVSLSISYQTTAECQEIESYFARRFPNIRIESWPITPLGRAKDNPELIAEHEIYDWDCLPHGCEAQKTFTPIVTTSGDVHLCYHLIMLLGRRDPLFVGNIFEKRLSEILNSIDDPLYEFILAYGGGGLGYIVSEIAPDIMNKKYQRVCEFCYEILSNPALIDKLRKILSLTDFREKVYEALRIKSKNVNLKLTDAKESIVICDGKNCFNKKGNRHMKHYLLNKLVDSRKFMVANLECVNCFQLCEKGPNILIKSSGKMMNHVDKAKIDSLIDSL